MKSTSRVGGKLEANSNRSSAHDRLERLKTYATICSAIAIPLVLAVFGYLVQRQLADEGLKKDYVSIAAGILKDNPANQEPELRLWAVQVLDRNSPIPFSKKVKEGLISGASIAVAGLAWIPPPAQCMASPKKRTVYADLEKLVEVVRTTKSQTDALDAYRAFVDRVLIQERDASVVAINLACMQDWARAGEKADINFREKIGAPSSKSILEESSRRAQAKVQPQSGNRSTQGK